MAWQALIAPVASIIDKLIPDQKAAAEHKLRLVELGQKGELAHLDADVRLAMGQMDINKADAQSQDGFQRRWRPAVGWVCVFGLLYTFFLRPLLPWIAAVAGFDVPPLPPIDTTELFVLLGGLLGLSTMRTVERINGKA